MHNVAQSSTANSFWSFPHKVKEKRLSSAITEETITCGSVMCNLIFHILGSNSMKKILKNK